MSIMAGWRETLHLTGDTGAVVRWLWKVAKGNRLQTALNAVIGVSDVALALLSVYAMRHAIDVASGATEGNLYWAIAFMGGIILLDFAVSISAVWVRNLLGVRAQNNMQRRMLDRVLRSEWQSRSSHHSGDIINRLEGDVNVVVNFLAETLPSALSTLLLFLGAFAYLFMLDHALALITVAIVPVCVVLSKFYVMKMRRLNRKVRDSDSRIQSVMQEIVQHLMLIKTLESKNHVMGKLTEQHSQLRENIVRRTKFNVLSNLTLNFGFAMSYLLTFGWSAVRLSAGTLTFGGMTAFLQLVNKIQNPARQLAHLIPQTVNVLTAAERLMELESIPSEKEGEPQAVAHPCSISLDGVSFRYDSDSRYILQDMTFTFRAGTSTAIVGETGAGKTTMIRLLLALVKPEKGSVRISNGDHEEEVTPLHRCNFVYVPQGNTLMSGTIRENLLIGKPEATDDELKDALHRSCADFVYELPEGLDTLCSEQGGGLSEGQAQRIAIARGLLRDRPVMLLDEATSSLDQVTERQLLDNILASHDKTVIFITHRMAVCEYCDEVLRVG